MPNWCSNTLTIEGPKEERDRFKEQAVGQRKWDEEDKEEDNELCFDKIIPTPPELLEKDYGAGAYEWEKQNWGCKWGACHTEITEDGDDYLQYNFSTAWSPPSEFVKRASEFFPELKFELQFDECGAGFQGTFACQNGDVLEDNVEDYVDEYEEDDEISQWGEDEDPKTIFV